MRRWQFALLLTALLTGCGYRDFQQLDEERQAAWQALAPLEQQRTALLANLLTSARALPGFDANQLARLADARAQVLALPQLAGLPDSVQLQRHGTAQAGLSKALAPVLQQVRQAQGLQALANQLDALENQIRVAGNRYNLATERYNALLGSFPSSLTARFKGLQPRPALPAFRP
jgi:LemA protein